jgi:ribosome recycling factor
MPELSEERRRDLVKTIKQMAEEARVRIRSHRRDGIDGAKKAQKGGEITEDDLRSLEKEVQELTDKYVKKIDESVSAKEAEIMKV